MTLRLLFLVSFTILCDRDSDGAPSPRGLGPRPKRRLGTSALMNFILSRTWQVGATLYRQPGDRWTALLHFCISVHPANPVSQHIPGEDRAGKLLERGNVLFLRLNDFSNDLNLLPASAIFPVVRESASTFSETLENGIKPNLLSIHA